MVPPRIAGRIMVTVGVAGVVLSLAATVLGAVLVGQIETSFQRSLSLTSDSLTTVEDSVVLAEDVVGLVQEGLGDTAATARQIELTLEEGDLLLRSAADLTRDDIAGSIASVESGLDTLVEVATVIDRTLSALSQLPLGPSYDPDEPFDVSLRRVQDSLEGLPDQLRTQADLLEGTADNLEEVQTTVGQVADDLAEIDTRLTAAAGLLSGYATAATDARALIDDTLADLRTQIRLARVLVVLLGLTIAAGQVVPLYIGWQLLNQTAS